MSLLLSLLVAAATAPEPVYGTVSDAPSIIAMQRFGACVVGAAPAEAERVLAMDFRTDDYAKALQKLAEDNARCLPSGGQFRSNGGLFAGALAEALIRRNRARIPAVADLKAPIGARSPLEAMALCTVLTAPDKARALFASEVTTKMESDASTALAPVLNECLQGVEKAELNRPALRAMLALAAWRLAATAGPGAKP